MKKDAILSSCRRYRYALTREWKTESDKSTPNKTVMFICLNPSTADETQDDPTIRRCIGYAKDWGCDKLMMSNLFAFRETSPNAMKKAIDPIGKDNDDILMKLINKSDLIVAGWGAHGSFMCRGDYVRNLVKRLNYNLHYLKLTKTGQPCHPLYLKKDLTPTKWENS